MLSPFLLLCLCDWELTASMVTPVALVPVGLTRCRPLHPVRTTLHSSRPHVNRRHTVGWCPSKQSWWSPANCRTRRAFSKNRRKNSKATKRRQVKVVMVNKRPERHQGTRRRRLKGMQREPVFQQHRPRWQYVTGQKFGQSNRLWLYYCIK